MLPTKINEKTSRDLLPITVLDWQHSIAHYTHTSRSCIVVDRVIYGKHDAHVDIIRIPFRP